METSIVLVPLYGGVYGPGRTKTKLLVREIYWTDEMLLGVRNVVVVVVVAVVVVVVVVVVVLFIW